jgi:ketosteroid isomerase-like protein
MLDAAPRAADTGRAMSQEKVEWTRQAAEAWNRGDQEAALALVQAHLAPCFEFDPLYLDRVYTGVEALRQVWAEATDTWQDYGSVVEDVVDLEDDVLVVTHVTGRGAGGGVPVDQQIFMLTRFEGEQAVWTKSFLSKAEALEAAGLRESAMSAENVDLVRRYFAAALAMGDRAAGATGRRLAAIDSPEASGFFEDYWHPRAVYDVSDRPDGGIYHGPAGVEQSVREWLAPWEEFEIEFKEYLSAGDRVVVVQDFRAVAEDGIEVRLRDLCGIYTVREGQFIHYEERLGRSEALQAVGLSE